MARTRGERQEAIREIVRGSSVSTQRELVERLEAAGFPCTQATVSRDIADMRLTKLPEGVYVLAEDLRLRQMVSQLVTSVRSVGNLVVVKSEVGTAQGVAAAFDGATLPHVVGTLAGDDTIFVVLESERDAQDFAAALGFEGAA